MKRLPLALLLFLPWLVACSGGGGSTPPSLSSSALAPLAIQAESSIRQQPYELCTNDLLYVGNAGSNSITVYRHNLSGNSAPMYVIAGSKTGLTNVGQLSQDAQGNLYVANDSSLLVFAHGANGNVAPIRKLAGPITGIHHITAMTVDKATNKIFVADDAGTGPDGTLLRFQPNANGNTAPYQTLQTAYYLTELTGDSTGQYLIAPHYGVEAHNYGVDFYYKQFPAQPSTPYPGGLSGGIYSYGIVDDPTTKTYLLSGSIGDGLGDIYGIIRFAEDTTGYGVWGGGSATSSFKPAIVSVLKPACLGQITLGYRGNIYSACSNAIYVYDHDASGGAKPIRILTGPATKLNNAYGIYEGQ